MLIKTLLLTIWLTTITHGGANSGISSSFPVCLDANGNEIDWFFMLKLPKTAVDGDHTVTTDGLQFVYWDANTGSREQKMRAGRSDINGEFSPLKRTMAQPLLTGVSEDINVLAYNDQPPHPPPHPPTSKSTQQSTHGHAKGILAFHSTTNKGMWIIHSIPRYPGIHPTDIDVPETAHEFGQSIVCLSLNSTVPVLELFLYTNPLFIRKGIPIAGQNLLVDKLTSDVDEQPTQSGTVTHMLKTLNDVGVYAFSKSYDAHEDIYADLVSRVLDSNLFVETWRHGPDKDLPSDCKPNQPHIYNVVKVNINSDKLNMSYKYTHDHSKWVRGEMAPFVCIGDLNRQEVQTQRGGSCVCLTDRNLWNIFQSLIATYDDCFNEANRFVDYKAAAASNTNRAIVFAVILIVFICI